MFNVLTLNDIKDRESGSYKKSGHQLDSVCTLLLHAIIMAKHSTTTNSIRVPAWYKYLKAITTTSPASYALKEEFSISNPKRLIEPTFTIPDVSAASAPIWITA